MILTLCLSVFSQLTHADQCDHMPPDYPSTKSPSNWPHIVHRPPGLDIKHMVYMPVWHVVLNIYLPCTNFHMPSQYLYKPCKAYVHCWENKCMLILKNHLPSRARNHKSLCALGQDLQYMPRACGHALMSSPGHASSRVSWSHAQYIDTNLKLSS